MPNKWHSFWHGKILEGEQIEVFVSPEGRWYVRAGKDEPADYEHQPKIKGLPVLRLKNVDHWRPEDERPLPPTTNAETGVVATGHQPTEDLVGVVEMVGEQP